MNKNCGIVTMCVTNGLFIVGKLVEFRLSDPRIFTYIDNGARIQLSPLPGNPTDIILKMDGLTYSIPETETGLLNLYHRVTHPQPELVEKSSLEPRDKKVIEIINPKLN